MNDSFAKAEHALAREHRSKAADFLARKELRQAGYELKAAAASLDGAAGWAGGDLRTAVEATVSDTHALGDELAFGANWTKDEMKKGFESLDGAIAQLGQKITGNEKSTSPKSGM